MKRRGDATGNNPGADRETRMGSASWQCEFNSMAKRLFAVLSLSLGLGAVDAAADVPGVHLIRGLTQPDRQPDGNSIVLTAPQGLIVFDTGRHAEHTQRIIEYARASGRPVRAIINSHWHLDHIGGNQLLLKTYPGARVYASDALAGALQGFLANYRGQLEAAIAQSQDPAGLADWRAEIDLIDAGSKLGPTEIVAGSGTWNIAGRNLDLHLERAVTAGDIWVFDRQTRTLLAGDLVTLPAPFLDTACPERWSGALAKLADVRFKELIPGHGAPMDRNGLTIYREAFDRLLGCAASARTKADCSDSWVRDGGTLLPAVDRTYARGLIDYYVDQVLRAAPERRAKLCAA